MSIIEVQVPQLSESVAEGTLATWKKKIGDAIARDEILIDIETDKVVLEVPSPGAGVLTAATAALEQRQLKPVAAVSVENNASDAAAAATKLLAAQPDALVLGLAGKPTIEVIKNVNQSRKGLQMYALSVLATAGNLKALGNDGSGVAISQVVPFPSNTVMPLVRDYQQAMKAAGVNEFSHLSLEGYLNARVVAEGIRRAGRNLSRESLITSLQSINRMDMGGMEIGFGKGASSASKFVELTVINSQGRLVK